MMTTLSEVVLGSAQRLAYADDDVGKAGQINSALGNFSRQLLQERQCNRAFFESRGGIASREPIQRRERYVGAVAFDIGPFSSAAAAKT